MIEQNALVKLIEDGLNTNSDGKEFKLFSDIGDLQKSVKVKNDITRYISGVFSVISSDLIPIKNLNMSFKTIGVSFPLDISLMGKDSDGNFIEVESVRNIIEEYIQANNGTVSQIEDEEAITYSVSVSFSTPTVGVVSMLSPIGEVLPIEFNIYYTIIEKGVNSNDWELTINGESIPTTSTILSRVKTIENTPFLGKQSTSAVIQTNGFGLDFVTPQLNTDLCDSFEAEILGIEEDNAYCVVLEGNKYKKAFLCAIADVKNTLTPNSNAGLNISMVEGKPDLLEYADNIWGSYEVESIGNTLVLFRNINEDEVVIFWGDGNFSFSSEENNSHIYENEGLYIVKVFNKDAVNNNWYEFSISIYTITYDLDGGEFIGEYPIGYNPLEEEDTSIPNPVKDGYTFTGWTGTDLEVPAINLIIEAGDFGNKEYTATWEIIDYSISYTLNGGTVSGTNPTTYNTESDEITLINPTKSGYTFTGWSGTGITGTSTSVVIPTGSYGTRTYTANWEVITYTITYVLNGGTNSSSNPSTYTIESSTISLHYPDERTGYMFVNWYTTSNFQSGTTIHSIPSGSTGNKTLYAKWQGYQYTMNYDVNGGIQNPNAGPISWPPDPKTVTFGSSIGSLYPLAYSIKSGYYPEGWYIDGDKISSSTVWSWDSNKTAVLNWELL